MVLPGVYTNCMILGRAVLTADPVLETINKGARPQVMPCLFSHADYPFLFCKYMQLPAVASVLLLAGFAWHALALGKGLSSPSKF